MRNTLVPIGFVGICLAAGGIGGWMTAASVRDWYPTLAKPGWTPPSWLFGPVWTLLYIMMGVSAFLAWRNSIGHARRSAMTWFAIQLLLNVAWSGIFFSLRQPGWAVIEIIALWLAIVATILTFRRTSGLAAVLMLPYIAWVSFAAALNIAIWRLNA